MPKKVRRQTRKKPEKLSFESLDEVLDHFDERQKENRVTSSQIQELTGFPPGQPLDALQVVQVVQRVFDKRYALKEEL